MTIVQDAPPRVTESDSRELLDFETARASVMLAQLDFEDTASKHGRGVALTMFNRRVGHWANQFTDKRLQRFAYVLGERMDGVTHTFPISQVALINHYEKWHGIHGWPKRARPSRRTIYRWTADLASHNIVTVNDGTGQRAVVGEQADYPGLQNESHTYAVDFSRVVVDGEVQPHDFMTVAPDSENVPSVVPSNVPSVVPSVVPYTSSSTSSKDSSLDSSLTSSSPGDGDGAAVDGSASKGASLDDDFIQYCLEAIAVPGLGMKSMLRAVRSWLNEAPDADDLDHRQAFLADSDWITGRLTEANVRTPWGYFRDSLDGIYCQWNDCPVLGAVLEEVTAPVEQPPAPQIVRWHAWYKPSNYLSDRTKVKSATRPAETADYIYLDDAELAEYKALAEYEAAERSARPVQPSRRRRRSLTD